MSASANDRPEASATGELIAQARAGSAEARNHLLKRIERYLLRVAGRRRENWEPALRVKAGASDLVQEALFEIDRELPRFRGATARELLAWSRRILLHD